MIDLRTCNISALLDFREQYRDWTRVFWNLKYPVLWPSWINSSLLNGIPRIHPDLDQDWQPYKEKSELFRHLNIISLAQTWSYDLKYFCKYLFVNHHIVPKFRNINLIPFRIIHNCKDFCWIVFTRCLGPTHLCMIANRKETFPTTDLKVLPPKHRH